ncbi:uncharacterized protein LOC118027371 [Mirounga leonina]|uniref:uncharacterized protein LOC118027371 n=1 Tax=Mirounga leonina TaxID=9715 RepID=UPI00156C20E5|nr:uncharacterized protein LOC118027371 [Mirounga leonina]
MEKKHPTAQVTAETPAKCGRAPPSLVHSRLHALDPGEHPVHATSRCAVLESPRPLAPPHTALHSFLAGADSGQDTDKVTWPCLILCSFHCSPLPLNGTMYKGRTF